MIINETGSGGRVTKILPNGWPPGKYVAATKDFRCGYCCSSSLVRYGIWSGVRATNQIDLNTWGIRTYVLDFSAAVQKCICDV